MRTLLFVLIAVLSAGTTFGQMKNQPKVVVVFLGPKNPTFTESDFPDLDFYYTPNLVLETSKKASDNTNKRAWSSALGIGRTAGAESTDSYTGTPAEIVDNGIHSGVMYLFDSEGLINAKNYNGESASFDKRMQFLVKFNNLQRKWESESFDDLMKTISKKGTALEKSKKSKKDDERYAIGKDFDNYEVQDKDGNSHSMNSLITGNPATLLVFFRVNPEYDLKSGKESGEGKKGKDYMNDVAQSVAVEKQIAPLREIENGIFGKRINP